MTTNHHTTIALGAALNAVTFNTPDGELDSAITDTLDATQEFSNLLAGSGSVDPSAIMELDSNTDGSLFPRMTSTQRNNISTPATGLIIYNTTTNQYENYNGSAWIAFSGSIPTISGARAYGTTQSIPHNLGVFVEYPTGERFDTDDYHDLVTNDHRITIPTGKGGIYLITGSIEFATPAAEMTLCYVSIRVGLNEIATRNNRVITGTLYSVRLSVTTLYELNEGDWITLLCAQNSGVALNLNGSVNYSPELTAVLLG